MNLSILTGLDPTIGDKDDIIFLLLTFEESRYLYFPIHLAFRI